MNDAPIAAEMPVSPKLEDLAKPAGAAAPLPLEAPPQAPGKPSSAADARRALEEIAAGPKGEATQAEQTAELGPDKEKVNMLLTQGAQLFLDAGDPRVAIIAVARSAAPTPIGTELRRDVVHMIAEMNGDTSSAIKKDIESLNLPKTDPARSEFAKFLEDYSRENPERAIDPALIEAIRTKKKDVAQTIAQILQTDTGLSAKLWAQMKGDGSQPAPNVATPEGLLKAAGLESTPENTTKARTLYEPKGQPALANLWKEVKSDFPALLITTGMITMLVSQLVSQESGAGGH